MQVQVLSGVPNAAVLQLEDNIDLESMVWEFKSLLRYQWDESVVVAPPCEVG